ncbi:MAG: translation elongation factor Ts [Phycisphaerae bacterium]|nr:translation elongation factor Ts [Phycisphaerae bacterium]
MAEIDAKTVMTLRNRTGLSMMECKKALQETNGDADAAEDFLKKKLKGKMDARTDRAAGEGRIAISVSGDGRAASIVELRAETDFTAKNENFLAVAKKVAELAVNQNAGDVTPTPEMTKIVDELRITTGENISIARVHKLAGGGSTMFGSYVHHDGKTGVLLQCEGSVSQDLAKDICMHITAAVPRPQGVDRSSVPAAVIDRERRLAVEMAMEAGKPKEIAEKMVEGKINKLYSDLALVEQDFVRDPTKKIKDLLPSGSSITAFLRWQVGEQA